MTGSGSDQQGPGGKRVQAVVLAGGGASGAYEVGVLKALLAGSRPPLEPKVFAGTSIGCFNSTFLVSVWDAHGPSAIGVLEQCWLERMATTRGRLRESICRFRGNPLDLLDPWAYVPDPLRPFRLLAGDGIYLFFEALRRASYLASGDGDLLDRLTNLLDVSVLLATERWEEITQSLDYASVRSSSRELCTVATNYLSGAAVYFTNQDMTDDRGPLAVRASAAIPGILPAVMIRAAPHVDGGVVMNTPLTLAIQAQAKPTEVHMIYLDPSVEEIPMASLGSTIDTSYRQELIGWAKAINENIEAVRRINQSLQGLERLRRSHAGRGIDFAALDRDLHTTRLRPLVVHRYHPHDDLAGGALGLLNFTREHIELLIARGFHDATHHNCRVSKCVLLDESDEVSAGRGDQPSPSPAGGAGRAA